MSAGEPTTASAAAKKLAATIVKRANEGVHRGLGVNVEFKPTGLETLIDMYFDDERKAERECRRRFIYRHVQYNHALRTTRQLLEELGDSRWELVRIVPYDSYESILVLRSAE